MRPRVQSRLKTVLAEHNLELLKKGRQPITIRQLAKATGLAQSTLTGMTANRHNQVSFETLSALCELFNRPPGDFLTLASDSDIVSAEPIDIAVQRWEVASR